MLNLQAGQVVGYKQFPRSFAEEAVPAKVMGGPMDYPLGIAWELELGEGKNVIAYETQILTGEEDELPQGDWDSLSKTAVALLGQLGVVSVRVTVKGEISGDILVDRDSMAVFVKHLRHTLNGGE